MCSLMVENATKPHPIFPREVWQQLFWLDHNFKIKLPDTTMTHLKENAKGFLMVQNFFILSDQKIVKKIVFLYHCHF